MKRAFIFFAAVAMLLIEASPLWTQGEPQLLEVIWKREQSGLQYSTVCKPARLAICSKRTKPAPFPRTYYLIDLKTGEDIYQTDPNTERTLYINYIGDRFFIYSIADTKWKEYDTKTKEYIQDAYGYDPLNFDFRFTSPDNCFVFFERERQMFLFTDINSGIVKDSFQIEGSTQDPIDLISWGMEFTIDSRYFNFTSDWLLDNNDPQTFHIYDRQTREIIFKRTTPLGSNFRYQYFNTSNKIAFAEEVQLPGDDKVYSYIRIFDPDSRTIVKDIRVESNYGFFISMDDKKLIYRQGSYNEVYDIENSKYLSYSHYTIHNGIILFDTNILYCYSNTVGISANRLDWTVGIDSRFEQKDTTIYPNPTNGMVSINITPEFVLGIWNVSDLQGRILKKGLIGHANKLDINISDLIPGTYYLTLTNKDSKSSYKLIKQ
jgi:hypothetical protein